MFISAITPKLGLAAQFISRNAGKTEKVAAKAEKEVSSAYNYLRYDALNATEKAEKVVEKKAEYFSPFSRII